MYPALAPFLVYVNPRYLHRFLLAWKRQNGRKKVTHRHLLPPPFRAGVARHRLVQNARSRSNPKKNNHPGVRRKRITRQPWIIAATSATFCPPMLTHATQANNFSRQRQTNQIPRNRNGIAASFARRLLEGKDSWTVETRAKRFAAPSMSDVTRFRLDALPCLDRDTSL